jgi:hypothetical protein
MVETQGSGRRVPESSNILAKQEYVNLGRHVPFRTEKSAMFLKTPLIKPESRAFPSLGRVTLTKLEPSDFDLSVNIRMSFS